MNNILSYIKWRGDLSFKEREFNEVDNLIFSILAYIDFSGIIPTIDDGGVIKLKEAYNIIFEKYKRTECLKVQGMFELPSSFLEEMANSRRFSDIKLFNYKDIYDKDLQIQFAALHIELDDETVYVAFRGTDQTILGWREDFAMTFQIVESQKEAKRYLEETMVIGNKNYRLGGHSKGGNLAVYGAMMCEDNLKNQIIEVYDNDGPGICKEILEVEKYEAIRNKIISIIPHFSVIGLLFKHDKEHRIVKSSANGIMQHDAMSWEVEADHLLIMEHLAPECKVLNGIFDTWIKDVSMEEREVFTKNFFDALEAGGAKQINEVANSGINGFESVLTAMVSSEKDTKIVVLKLIKSVIKSFSWNNLNKIWKTKGIIRGIGIVILGLFFIKVPENALQIIGTVIVVVVIAFAIKRLVYRITQKLNSKSINQYIVIFYITLITFSILSVIQEKIIIFFMNFTLGVIFSTNGILKLKSTMKCLNKNQKLCMMPLGYPLLSIMLGIVALVTPSHIMKQYIFSIGSFMIIEGIREVMIDLSRNTTIISIL
ncbi:Mbeg1-like protein [Clostridium nigeriense]|uniref:Mbeg1-like protein n=1 Tax=Clostridium nigeriense TaxID=1805470 RepID=UPI003D349665